MDRNDLAGDRGRARPFRLERFVIYEQLTKHGAPVSESWMADRQIGPTLLQFGNDEQRRYWLREVIACRISEPGAGSDMASASRLRLHDHGRYCLDPPKHPGRTSLGLPR
jgi:alkylation response protein AidB-like acyl-CoA dehydrogenase